MLKCCLSDEGNIIKKHKLQSFQLEEYSIIILKSIHFSNIAYIFYFQLCFLPPDKKSLDVSAYFICHLAHLYLNKTCKLHHFPIPCCSYGTHGLSYANNFKFTFIGIKICFKNVQWSFSGTKLLQIVPYRKIMFQKK